MVHLPLFCFGVLAARSAGGCRPVGKEIGCCWPVCADEGSSVASVLMRETVACGRLKREDLSAVGCGLEGGALSG
jgi:hypothetical protein